MDIYSTKHKWKWWLGLAGIVIVILSFFYSNYLATRLMEEEKKKAELWVLATKLITATPVDAGGEDPCDYTLHFKVQSANTTIPAILVNDRGLIDGWVNFETEDKEVIEKELERIKRYGPEPIEIDSRYFKSYVYYKRSFLLTLLSYFPLLQILLIGAFVGIGYMAFSAARRAEQNRVWVGMAKETAHQLGTPISAIMAWLEHLKLVREGDEETGEIIGELQNDVNRLELVADRFSKIGSEPVMEAVDIFEELEKCRAYMQPRSPRKVTFHFPEEQIYPLRVNINPHLFDWVVENLIRNALDAMGGKGTISARVTKDEDFVYVDIRDSGKGIPPSKFKNSLQPRVYDQEKRLGPGLIFGQTDHRGISQREDLRKVLRP
jgi:hypothetical protein